MLFTRTTLRAAASGVALAAVTAVVALPSTGAAAPLGPEIQRGTGAPDVAVEDFRFPDMVMTRKHFDGVGYFVRMVGTVKVEFDTGVTWQDTDNRVTAQLRVNGDRAPEPFDYVGLNPANAALTKFGAFVPNDVGAGRWTLGPLELAIVDQGVERSESIAVVDSFYIRRPSLAAIAGTRSGRKVTIKVRAQFRDAHTWRLKSAGSAVVERKVGRGWQLVRKVRVNAAGRATLGLRSPARVQYRVRIVQTDKTASSTAITRGRV